jgi:hypothetical protein
MSLLTGLVIYTGNAIHSFLVVPPSRMTTESEPKILKAMDPDGI